MADTHTLQDFDPGYLRLLKTNLVPTLRKYPGYMKIEDIALDPELFVNAVITLIRNGFFEDDLGYQRLEFGKNEVSIRYVPDYEINMQIEVKNERRNSILNKQ